MKTNEVTIENQEIGKWFYAPVKHEDGKTYVWHSICSVHSDHDPSCHLCNSGEWVETVYSNQGE